ncbi:hypothetical protein [Rickettsiella massiliensis]|uniref:hypothetical protein n=1 Tax=Rickettsiella massiliensis TaxID=676517 RepID=UPI00029AE5A7|nr:hypothetical protein [Rickettsiella massiliensis]
MPQASLLILATAAAMEVGKGVMEVQAAKAQENQLDLQAKQNELQYQQSTLSNLDSLDKVIQRQAAQMTTRGVAFSSPSFNATQRNTENIGQHTDVLCAIKKYESKVMAESFAQFKDEVPILRDTKIASGAKGFESIGQALGNVSQGLIQTDLRLEQEKSNALLLQATSSADQIKSDALVKLKPIKLHKIRSSNWIILKIPHLLIIKPKGN